MSGFTICIFLAFVFLYTMKDTFIFSKYFIFERDRITKQTPCGLLGGNMRFLYQKYPLCTAKKNVYITLQ